MENVPENVNSALIVSDVPYNTVLSNPNNARKHFDPEKLKSLAASIDQGGLQQFPVVVPIPDKPGFYMIESGERRYRAVGLLKWSTIPVVINTRGATDGGGSRVRGLVENLQRVDITPYEAACEMTSIHQTYKLSGVTIAKMSGLSASYVNRLISIREAMSDDVLKLWAEGNPRATVDFLNGLVKVPKAKQLDAFKDPTDESGSAPATGSTPRNEPKWNVRKAAEKVQAALLQMSADDKAAVKATECVAYILGSRKKLPQGVRFADEE